MKVIAKKSLITLFEYIFGILLSVSFICVASVIFPKNIFLSIFSFILGMILLILMLYALVDYLKFPFKMILIDDNQNIYLSKYNVSIPIHQITKISSDIYRSRGGWELKQGDLTISYNRRKYRFKYVCHCNEVAEYLMNLQQNYSAK